MWTFRQNLNYVSKVTLSFEHFTRKELHFSGTNNKITLIFYKVYVSPGMDVVVDALTEMCDWTFCKWRFYLKYISFWLNILLPWIIHKQSFRYQMLCTFFNLNVQNTVYAFTRTKCVCEKSSFNKVDSKFT